MSHPTLKDFFVSYTSSDRTWAEWIAWVLEEAGYTVVIQAWDFRPGGNFVLDMQRATIEANRTIAVLSSLYLDKPFPQPEWAAAFAQDPTSRDRKLIPVRVENCNPPGLLAQIVYVDVFGCEETEAQQRLLSAVTDGRMKPTQRPHFPGKVPERLVPQPVPFPGTAQDTQLSAPHNATSTSQSLPLSLSAYDAETWVGRDAIITTLTQKLQLGCRLLALTGITGIGKTALAERLVVAVQENGVPFHRLNFDDRGQGRDFPSGALALLPKLGETVTTEDQKDPQNALRHLLRTLRNKRFLIQIDSLEMVLQGDDETGWNAFTDDLWLDFFQQLLAGEDCQSQLLLTSQALPEALEEVGSRYPRSWYRQNLDGLSEAEQLQLFEKFGLKPDGLGADVLQRFVEIYQGHPLVLQVIARDILEKPFNGNVQQYWQRYQAEFDEMERNRKQKGNSPRSLQLRVKQRVEQSLKRLPTDAYHMLCRSAVYRRPVPEEFWLAMLSDLPEDRQWTALEFLKSHNLAEQELRGDGLLLLRQHNLVRSVTRQLLKMDEAVWREAERTATHVWMAKYEPEPVATKLEQVRSSLEAFYHNSEAENWEAAKAILIDQGVSYRLQRWGYFRQVIPLYKQVLGRLCAVVDMDCESGIGNAYKGLSSYFESVKHFQQSITIAREIGDRQREGNALVNLGVSYHFLGKSKDAIECIKQSLHIYNEIGNQSIEVFALNNLGMVYRDLGNYEKAFEYHQKQLTIAQETDDIRSTAYALANLGIAEGGLGKYVEAVEHLRQALVVFHEKEEQVAEGEGLFHLGLVYYDSGNYKQANECFQQALVIASEIGSRLGEVEALGGLGLVCYSSGSFEQASRYYQQKLAIAREIGHRQEEGTALVTWGATLIKLDYYLDAQQRLQESLEIFQELNARKGEAEALLRLGELYHKISQPDLAQEYCDRALSIAPELGIPLVKECEELRALLASDAAPES